MAALQKFKLFATQCGVAQSPTRSPKTSPLVQLRRPKTTLRSLLTLSRSARRPEHMLELEKKERDPMRRHSLKDLFVSSPPREEELHATATTPMLAVATNPAWTGFRCRSLLKRKYWRPLLLTIPE